MTKSTTIKRKKKRTLNSGALQILEETRNDAKITALV